MLIRNGAMAALRSTAAIVFGMVAAATVGAQSPYGLESRAPIAPYLNKVMPPLPGAFPYPATLSATGAFRDLQTLEPANGLIPFAVNSPLWTDGAIKNRWMAVPNDGPPYGPEEQIDFTPVGEWSFPAGTVFVKEFDLTVNEATGERRRLETRLLVRRSDGGVYGVTYKWRADQSDADLLPNGLEEDIPITTATGATRIQRYSYPSRGNCLFCHNAQANFVLGVKTHQLNGDLTYPATGRTDNQLRTLNHLGMLNPAQNEANFASYLKSVSVTTTTAPVQYRMRSWIDANCSHCHRPGGFGPGYDGRFYTPLGNQNLIDNYVRFRDLPGSLLYQRDNALDGSKMPPIAKNVIHEGAMENLRQWIASPLEVIAVTLGVDTHHLAVRFNSRVAPDSIKVGNFEVDRGVVISNTEASSDPQVAILTVSSLGQGQSYTLTLNEVRDTALSANTIWPHSRKVFVADFASPPPARRLANISTRGHVTEDDPVLIGGFIARGSGPKRVLIRGLGPSLSSSGVSGALSDPVLQLFDSAGKALVSNNDWEDNANRQEIIDTGIAPASAREATLLKVLPASATGVAYTVVLRGAPGATGIGLIEIYDLDRTADAALANIATRGSVRPGDSVMIAGFIVSGTEPQKVIIRALGPSTGLAGALQDPTLELYDGNGAPLTSNDNWVDSPDKQAIIDSTVPPRNDFESAIVRVLTPGPYSAIVRGASNTVGIALVEVYALP